MVSEEEREDCDRTGVGGTIPAPEVGVMGVSTRWGRHPVLDEETKGDGPFPSDDDDVVEDVVVDELAEVREWVLGRLLREAAPTPANGVENTGEDLWPGVPSGSAMREISEGDPLRAPGEGALSEEANFPTEIWVFDNENGYSSMAVVKTVRRPMRGPVPEGGAVRDFGANGPLDAPAFP